MNLLHFKTPKKFQNTKSNYRVNKRNNSPLVVKVDGYVDDIFIGTFPAPVRLLLRLQQVSQLPLLAVLLGRRPVVHGYEVVQHPVLLLLRHLLRHDLVRQLLYQQLRLGHEPVLVVCARGAFVNT